MVQAIAKQYVARGWSVVPIPALRKGPVLSEWQRLRLAADEIDSHFAARTNVGVLLGEPSGELIDIDLDHPLAVELASDYLPETGAVFGRPGKPNSHRLYRVTAPVATHKRALPKVEGKAPSVVELRSTGCQTLFPGSVHPSGEPIEWTSDSEPAVIDPDKLRAAVDALADEVERRLGVERVNQNGAQGHKTVNRIPVSLSDDSKVSQARRYLAKVPGAVAGQGGDDHTFTAACRIVLDFDLSPDEALPLLAEWNQRCSPPWPEHRLRYKLDEADKQPGERGTKLNGWRAAANGQASQLVGGPEQPRFEIRRLTSLEFDQGDYTVNYLVEGVLAERQQLVIAAPLKTLKTTIAVALAIALALCRPFLGKFWVREAVNVLILSGESGLSALQIAGRRIAESYGFALGDIGRLFWSSDLPRLGDLDHLDAVRRAIVDDEIAVLICDPLYFMLPGQDAGNLMIVGAYLRTLSALCEELGVTLVVVHHIKRTGIENRHAPPELSQVSWAGTSEWARQWILLSRRKDYVPGTGEHKLWMVTGGSAGHSGLHALDIFEGVGDARTWRVDVLSPDDVRSQETDGREQAKEARRAEQLERDKREIVQAMVKLAGKAGTKSDIRDHFPRNTQAFNAALAALLRSGDVLKCKVPKDNGQTYDGYRLNDDDK